MGNGVIGNTAVSGTVIQGSSPCSPASFEGRPAGRPSIVFPAAPGGWWPSPPLVVCWGYLAPSSSGLGHHPLKVAARVRIPLGLPKKPHKRPPPPWSSNGPNLSTNSAPSRTYSPSTCASNQHRPPRPTRRHHRRPRSPARTPSISPQLGRRRRTTRPTPSRLQHRRRHRPPSPLGPGERLPARPPGTRSNHRTHPAGPDPSNRDRAARDRALS